MSIPKHTIPLLTFLGIALLTGWFLHPALLGERSLVHGDNLHHGYSVLTYHSKVLRGELSLLWTNLVYGGHPLFAEGQAGLSNPLNILVAWLFAPEFGHNFIHWVSMIAIGMGCYGLCRTLDISQASSMFAAIAVALSGLFLLANSNMTAMEASIWIPWTIWAFEVWLKKPDLIRGSLFGLATAMLILSGYPHFFHGTVLYMLLSLATFPFEKNTRKNLPMALKIYVQSGFWAIVVCAGVSAFQWIPLLELASYSHRQEGTNILLEVPMEFYIRGMMYYIDLRKEAWFYPIVGSLLVSVLASLFLFSTRSSLRVTGHLISVFVLTNLAIAQDSPLYLFVREHNLIPGMSNFRAMFPYFYIAVFGFCIFAGKSLDWLATTKLLEWKSNRERNKKAVAAILFFTVWGYLIYQYHIPEVSMFHYVTLTIAVFSVIAANLANSRSLIPLLAVAILVLEVLVLRIEPFQFIDNRILMEQPKSVKIILSDPQAADFKHHHISAGGLAFSRPIREEMERFTRDELNHIVASTNLLWNIPSFTGAFALKTDRKLMINNHITEEIEGTTNQVAGLRLIDILSIKYISIRQDYSTDAFKILIRTNDPVALVLAENTAAKPRFQTYRHVVTASDAENAFEIIKNLDRETLIIETDDELPSLNPTISSAGETPPTLELTQDSATSYKLVTQAPSAFWLFLSDANYPGWKARVDGQPTPVYTAQIIGKAIYIPRGSSEIELYFKSKSFKLGLVIGIITLLLMGFGMVLSMNRIKIKSQVVE